MSNFAELMKTYSGAIGATGDLLGGAGGLYSGIMGANIANKQLKLAENLVNERQDKQDEFQSNMANAYKSIYG